MWCDANRVHSAGKFVSHDAGRTVVCALPLYNPVRLYGPHPQCARKSNSNHSSNHCCWNVGSPERTNHTLAKARRSDGSRVLPIGIGEKTMQQCKEQTNRIHECVMPLSVNESVTSDDNLRRKFMSALRGQRILVVGDSMARQSFVTLVSLLRGSKDVIDVVVQNNKSIRSSESAGVDISYTQATTDHGTVIDLLDLPWTPHMSNDPILWSNLSKSTHDSLCDVRRTVEFTRRIIERVKAPGKTRVDYMFLPCYADSERAMKQIFSVSDKYTQVIYHMPMFWPIRTVCTSAETLNTITDELSSNPLNVSRNGPVSLHWQRWRTMPDTIRYVVVNAPTTHLGFGNIWTRRRVQRMGKLTHTLLNLTFPQNWAYVDVDPAALNGGINSFMSNWHFACQLVFWRSAAWLRSAEVPTLHMRESGDCFENMNTVMWTESILAFGSV